MVRGALNRDDVTIRRMASNGGRALGQLMFVQGRCLGPQLILWAPAACCAGRGRRGVRGGGWFRELVDMLPVLWIATGGQGGEPPCLRSSGPAAFPLTPRGWPSEEGFGETEQCPSPRLLIR